MPPPSSVRAAFRAEARVPAPRQPWHEHERENNDRTIARLFSSLTDESTRRWWQNMARRGSARSEIESNRHRRVATQKGPEAPRAAQEGEAANAAQDVAWRHVVITQRNASRRHGILYAIMKISRGFAIIATLTPAHFDTLFFEMTFSSITIRLSCRRRFRFAATPLPDFLAFSFRRRRLLRRHYDLSPSIFEADFRPPYFTIIASFSPAEFRPYAINCRWLIFFLSLALFSRQRQPPIVLI